MKTPLVLLALFFLVSCKQKPPVEVTRIGQLEELIKKGDMKTKAKMADYAAVQHLYAIGSVTNLKGFVQVLDGKPYTASVVNGQVRIDTTFDAEVTLLLYASVPQWKEFEIPEEVKTWNQMQQFVGNLAEKFNVSRHHPFPFLLTGTARRLSWRVVDWDPADQEITYKKTVESGLSGELQNEYINGIGFYSKEPYDVLSHKDFTIHLHFVNASRSLAGHIDDIEIGPGMKVLLPLVDLEAK